MTRPENHAYSIMGLFRVSMPLLYGEAGEAFPRLQKHIVKKTDDESILAFCSNSSCFIIMVHWRQP